jgi:hypothetical protein
MAEAVAATTGGEWGEARWTLGIVKGHLTEPSIVMTSETSDAHLMKHHAHRKS